MNARDLKIVMPGDKIKFKKGWMNAGCHATFIRLIPAKFEAFSLTKCGVDQIEYEFAGQRKIASHDRFTLKK